VDKIILTEENTDEITEPAGALDQVTDTANTGDEVDTTTTTDPEVSEPVVDPVTEKAAAQAAVTEERKFVRDEAVERLVLHLPELDEIIEADKANLAKKNEERKARGEEERRFSVVPAIRQLLREKNIIPDELLRDEKEVPSMELRAILQRARSLDRKNQERVNAREAKLEAQEQQPQPGSRAGTPAPKSSDRRATQQTRAPKPRQPDQQQRVDPVQTTDTDAEVSDEYKAKSAAAKAQHDRNQSIADLVTLDGVGGVHVPKGSGKTAGRYISENEASLVAAFQDDIRDGAADRQKENDLLERSKNIAPAVTDVEAALAAAQGAIQNGTKTEAEVIRAALVAAGVYGSDTARIIGNITSDDEITTLFNFARGNGAASSSAVSSPAVPTALVAPQITVTPSGTVQQGSGQPLQAPQISTPGSTVQGSGQPLIAPQITITTPTTTPQGSGQPLVAPQIPTPGSNPNTPPATPNVLTPAQELLEKQIELEEARIEWAKYSAKRHRRVVFGFFLRRSSKYQAAQERYQTLSREVAKRELADTLANIDQDPALTTDEQRITQKRATVDAHWISEQNQLRGEATKFVEDRLWWKVINGTSNWMNKGGKFKRFAKRATLGIVAGAAASLTFGAGTVGAVGAVMAVRFGNAQLRHTTGGIGKLTAEQEAALKNERMTLRARSSDDILENRANAFTNIYEKDGDKQRTKRMIAVGKSATVAAVGFGAGLAAHAAYDAASGWIGGLGDHANATGGGPRVEEARGSGTGVEGNTGNAGAGVAETPAVTSHDLLNPTGAYYVRPGEGWYETFQDMGIPQDSWANILKDAGPKLRDLGVADFNTSSNQWWISHSGNLPADALRTIADSSAKFGYTFNKF
jgi:hypothetical protein